MNNAKPLSKRILLLACCLALLPGLLGCKKEDPAPADNSSLGFTEPGAQPSPGTPPGGEVFVPEAAAGGENSASTPSGAPAPMNAQSYSATPEQPGSVDVLDSAACALLKDRMLYGGVAYKNTGSAPITLEEATFTFSFSGGSQKHTFAPVAAAYDVVNPGETAYCTLWLPYEKEGALPQDVSVSAELRAQTTDRAARALQVGSGYLVQNYPRFATLSGRLTNPMADSVDLSMVYAAFYDAGDNLLGIWYFPRNALLQPGEGAPFVSHLQSLPIPNLAENTASMQFRAFGM